MPMPAAAAGHDLATRVDLREHRVGRWIVLVVVGPLQRDHCGNHVAAMAAVQEGDGSQ